MVGLDDEEQLKSNMKPRVIVWNVAKATLDLQSKDNGKLIHLSWNLLDVSYLKQFNLCGFRLDKNVMTPKPKLSESTVSVMALIQTEIESNFPQVGARTYANPE